MDEQIEFNDEEDGSLSIDFCAGQGKMLAISIEPNGEICWAFHWDGHTEHGTHKAQRTWVGLTDDERNLISTSHAYVDMIIRAAEAKLKEKNSG